MKFYTPSKNEIKTILENTTKAQLLTLLNYIADDLSSDYKKSLPKFIANKSQRTKATKASLKALFMELLIDDMFKLEFYKKLSSTPDSIHVYNQLVWIGSTCLSAFEVQNINTNEIKIKEKTLFTPNDLYKLINTDRQWNSCNGREFAYIDIEIREVLKLLMPKPKDFTLNPIKNPPKTEWRYSNENGILDFIDTFNDMLKSNLIEFNKNETAPLKKSITLVKNSIDLKEFYNSKNIDTLATNMLIQLFYHYNKYKAKTKKSTPLELLKDALKLQLEDKLPFYISKIFTHYLKRVRFDYNTDQIGLFNIIINMLNDTPKDNSWVSIENIEMYSVYRDLEFHFEYSYKTSQYEIEIDSSYLGRVEVARDYMELFFLPILKGAFFYLSALGVLEIEYNNPQKHTYTNTKDRPYLSHWDGLLYYRLTPLGKYLLGFEKKYNAKTKNSKVKTIVLDKNYPIIRVDKDDLLSNAKLEPFTTKIEDGKYRLDHNKIFKDCKTNKDLESKIDQFYQNIEPKPPKPFKEFFDELKSNSNLLKKESHFVVVSLTPNPKLLKYIQENRKIQELFIKAQGYKIVISKTEIPKLNKLLKDGGFFVNIKA